MASPPFNPVITTPGDTDIVSQYPLAERTFRDIINSWILVNHDNNGRHSLMGVNQVADPVSPPPSGITDMWMDSNGNLKTMSPISVGPSAEFLVPVGIVLPYLGASAPPGWLFPVGQQLSQTTYARLFALIGTTYNTGGETGGNFRMPDLRGRTIFGLDNMGGSSSNRITSASGFSGNGIVLGGRGGSETITLLQTNLPAATFPNTLSGTIQEPNAGTGHNHVIQEPASGAGHQHQITYNTTNVLNGTGGSQSVVTALDATSFANIANTAFALSGTTVNRAPTGVTLASPLGGSVTSGGSSTPTINMPPGMTLNFIVKW